MEIYEMIKNFKKQYRSTIAWRIKRHSRVIEKHLNPGETVTIAFAAQGDRSSFEIFNTYAVVLTNKRILLAQKRVVFGYTFLAITPDMFNDLTVYSGLIWGKIYIDTVKEIETQITEYMMNEKKKYFQNNNRDS